MQPELDATEQVSRWIEQCVLGLSLCPYARQPWSNNSVRIRVCALADHYIQCIDEEARALIEGTTETVLVVLKSGLSDFLEFNDFLDEVEQRLYELDLDDQLQIASFHPHYLFAGEAENDASNYTNRAPLPIVQLLRVESVSKAVESGQTLTIPDRNIQTLRGLDGPALTSLFPWVEPT